MATLTVEGLVENGRIRLRDTVTLPEHTRVYVVIPDVDAAPIARTHSPRLRHGGEARDFAKKVIEVTDASAGLTRSLNAG